MLEGFSYWDCDLGGCHMTADVIIMAGHGGEPGLV